MKTIYLAGGCFWGVEGYFKRLKGVVEVSSGYINGNKANPTYEEVCNGVATHAEAVRVDYNESEISLNKLLDYFFRVVDPYSLNKQGNDVGIQYRSGIYYDNEDLKPTIEQYLLNKFGDKLELVKTELEPNKGYYLAEDYHQDYLTKNVDGYCHINLLDIDASDLK